MPNPERRGFRALVSDEDWVALLDAGHRTHYRRGDVLLRQGMPGNFVLALTVGRVKVLRRLEDGTRLLVALRAAGDLLGEMAVRGTLDRTATVEAVDDCAAHYVTAMAFDRVMNRRKLQGALTDYVVSKLNESIPYRVQLVHFRPMQRFSRLLAELVSLAGPELPEPMSIPFSHEALALSLGLARSTVSEVISSLRHENVLGPGPRLTVIDMAGLLRHTSQTV